MKKKLYLITTDFPYGKGENSFIMPELPYLKEKFDITIISHSLDDEMTVVLDDDIQIVHYNRNVSLFWKLWDSICYFGSKDSYIELWDILRSRKKIIKRIFESIIFFEEAKRFERFIKKNNCIDDSENVIVYTYWFTYYCLTFTRLFGKKANVKLVTRAHRYDLYDEGFEGLRQPFKKQMDKVMEGIVFIAEHGRKYYLDKYRNENLTSKYQLFRLGVIPNEKAIKKEKITSTEFLLVSCSLVIPRKRVDLIVNALAEISDICIRWIHFGDGPDYTHILELAKNKLEDKSNIVYELRGYADTGMIMRFYSENNVDAFITTTESEGCPVSVQEAMAYSIPIIGTAIAEIPYMINGNGVLLNENPKAQEISEAITYIFNLSDEEKNRMRTCSYQLWKENFNGRINAKRFVDYLDSL